MTEHAGIGDPGVIPRPSFARLRVVSVLGIMQILAWGSSYYLLAVVAGPLSRDTGWTLPWIVGGLSLGLLVAAVVSPRVGRAIETHGGRPVLALSAVLLAAGLLMMGLATSLPVYLMAWIVIGAGMGAGLYDAAFSTLGRYYGDGARGTIATLTLFGGFASTVCWPISAWLVEAIGWRGACFAYAGVHLGLALPAYLLLLPRADRGLSGEAARRAGLPRQAAPFLGPPRSAFVLLAAVITISSAVTSLMSVYLLEILRARGLELAAAVALGALVGPSQVGARAVEMALGRYYHPLWTMIAAMALMATGLSLMLIDLPLMALPLVLYGAGIGIKSIARGTVPLALFGAAGYPAVIGRLALYSLLAQAAAPFIGAFLMEQGGSGSILAVLAGLSLGSLAMAFLLRALWRGAGPTAA